MSTINYYDRVKDTSASEGTGDFTLANSPASGFRSFDAAAGHAGNHFPYVIDGGANVEVGHGHLSDAVTLVRDTVLYSTNANALVSFPPGAKTVFIDVPANALTAFRMQLPIELAIDWDVDLQEGGGQFTWDWSISKSAIVRIDSIAQDYISNVDMPVLSIVNENDGDAGELRFIQNDAGGANLHIPDDPGIIFNSDPWETTWLTLYKDVDYGGFVWGSAGTDGKTILYGTAAPTTEGVDGDFYIRTTTNFIYGPKASGSWPSGVSLVGPTGPGLTGLTTNTLPKATGSSSAGDSSITDDGTLVRINDTSSSAEVNIGTAMTSGAGIKIGGGERAGIQILSDNTGYVVIGDIDGSGNGLQLLVHDGDQTFAFNNGVVNTNGLLTRGEAFEIQNPSDVSHTTALSTSSSTSQKLITFPDAEGVVQLENAQNKGCILAVPVNNTVLPTATGTVYASPGNDGTPLSVTSEGDVSFPVTRSGTIRNLFVRTGGTAKVNTPTTVIRIRKNGVNTSVAVTMVQTVNTTTSDTENAATVDAGDLITLSFVTTGTAAVSTSIASVSFELD